MVARTQFTVTLYVYSLFLSINFSDRHLENVKKKFNPGRWAVRFHFGKISLDNIATLETTCTLQPM